MLPNIDSSLLFLFLGKESPWIPWILLVILLIQKGPTLAEWIEHRVWMWGKAEYSLTGTLYTDKSTGSCHGTLPNEMSAFLYFLQSSKLAQSIQKGMTIYVGCCMSLDEASVTIPLSGHGLWIQPGLYAKFEMQTEQSQFRKSTEDEGYNMAMEERKLTITIQAHQGDFNTIRDFLQTCVRSYKEYKENRYAEKTIYVVKPSLENSRLEGDSTRYIPFESTKTFDNLFFRGKAELLQRLDQFKERDSLLVKRMGLPATLGLLFYGEPGTGKTSAIKAIANYMQMHLVIVPMNKIKTRRDLERIFFNTDICHLPFDKRIYVFEEIDCNGWEGIVVDRKLQPTRKDEDAQSDEWETDLVPPSVLNKRIQKRKREEDDKLTLGALLEMLDGVVECPGRMVIMTTNRRGVLDPALIRPGRIDIEVEFGFLGRAEIGKIYERMWGMEVDPDIVARIPEDHYTQAKLSQILYKYATDPNKFLTALLEDGRIPVSPKTG